jgi:hypothetical protein
MSRASGSDRASRSSLITTKVAPHDVPQTGGQLGQRWYVHDRRPLRRLRPNPYEIGVLF